MATSPPVSFLVGGSDADAEQIQFVKEASIGSEKTQSSISNGCAANGITKPILRSELSLFLT